MKGWISVIYYIIKKSFLRVVIMVSSIILCSDGYVINFYDSEIYIVLLVIENVFLNWIGIVYIIKEFLRIMMFR